MLCRLTYRAKPHSKNIPLDRADLDVWKSIKLTIICNERSESRENNNNNNNSNNNNNNNNKKQTLNKRRLILFTCLHVLKLSSASGFTCQSSTKITANHDSKQTCRSNLSG